MSIKPDFTFTELYARGLRDIVYCGKITDANWDHCKGTFRGQTGWMSKERIKWLEEHAKIKLGKEPN